MALPLGAAASEASRMETDLAAVGLVIVAVAIIGLFGAFLGWDVDEFSDGDALNERLAGHH
jgi:hypothetical protein